eukprot:scaffold131539_cov33-Tisochrysis_lutea.AAC.7
MDEARRCLSGIGFCVGNQGDGSGISAPQLACNLLLDFAQKAVGARTFSHSAGGVERSTLTPVGSKADMPDEYITSRKSHFQISIRRRVQHDEKAPRTSTGVEAARASAQTSAPPAAASVAVRSTSSDGSGEVRAR